jgi:hypothetical protein
MIVAVTKAFDVSEVAQLGRYCCATFVKVHIFQEVFKGEDILLAKI